MRQIPRDVALAAEKCLTTDDGRTVMAWLVRDFGLMERAFIPDSNGKVSPINAAIRDGERGVVSVLFQLSRGETIDPNNHE